MHGVHCTARGSDQDSSLAVHLVKVESSVVGLGEVVNIGIGITKAIASVCARRPHAAIKADCCAATDPSDNRIAIVPLSPPSQASVDVTGRWSASAIGIPHGLIVVHGSSATRATWTNEDHWVFAGCSWLKPQALLGNAVDRRGDLESGRTGRDNAGSELAGSGQRSVGDF
uniref:Uncharacterized protein n=1 Tax=uncultured marine virus TaxID=186617 RepID=A0A0F7L344_9VIRU|nr:hypothetical protein [uncultured marine virus]